MGRSIGGREVEYEAEQRDTELTLGPGMLAMLGGGLLLLCGLCFVLGYAAGNRHAEPLNASGALPPAAQPAMQSGTAATKPQAAVPAPAPATDPTTDAAADATPDPGATPGGSSAQAASQPVTPNAGVAPAPVRSALAQPAVVQSAGASGGTAGQIQPALPQGSGTMVQIATFAQAEDADVLVSALRRRGFPASVRRDALDGSLHVQVGPFASRNDASLMRQQLLKEGYNAVVQ